MVRVPTCRTRVKKTRAVHPVQTWRHATTSRIRHRQTWDAGLRMVESAGPRPIINAAEHLQVAETCSVVLLNRREIWIAQPHGRVLHNRMDARADLERT